MVIVWRLRGNIIRTGLCWFCDTMFAVCSTYVSSSYRSNRLGLSHWESYAVRRGGCLELYYCNMVEWFWWDSSLISTTNWFPSVLWHYWFGHLACKNRPRNDLWCVEWDVKPYTLTHSATLDLMCSLLCTQWILPVIRTVAAAAGGVCCSCSNVCACVCLWHSEEGINGEMQTDDVTQLQYHFTIYQRVIWSFIKLATCVTLGLVLGKTKLTISRVLLVTASKVNICAKSGRVFDCLLLLLFQFHVY